MAVVISIVILLAGTHWKAYHAGEKSVAEKWNAERLLIAQKTLQIAQDAAAKTAAVQALADKRQRDNHARIASLNTALATAIDGLRNRPERPTDGDMSKAAGTDPNTGYTGASLYKPDADFLVRESARADRLLADLDQCQSAYLAAREALK